MAVLMPEGKQSFQNSAGAPLVGGKLYTYDAGTNTPRTTYSDAAGTVSNTNPVILDARGEAAVFWSGSYKLVLKDASDITIWTVDNVTDGVSGLLSSLSSSTGDSLLGSIASEAGAVATTQQTINRLMLHAGAHFGCDTTGVTNTTTKLKAFYDACIAGGKNGTIPPGTYKLTPGVLIFDNGFTDKAWPNIHTAGNRATIFQIDSATETDTPLLVWKNGVANSAAGKYWRGGSHGGVNIKGSGTGPAYPNQHHISLTGTWGIQFGWMESNNCKGSSFYCPQALYAGNNPDPYANSFLHFDGLESSFAAGYGFCNANYVGMDSWYVENVRIIQPSLGGWYGIGSGNIINNWSVANVTGWAFDDGTYAGAPGGSPQRNYIEIAEFDNVQYGIRLNKSSRTKFIGVRFPTRYQTTPNTTATYWPLVSVDLAGGSSPSVLDVDLDLSWRLESGGAVGALGTFIQTTANGKLNSTVDWQDNGGLSFTETNFLSKCTLRFDTPAYITRNSKPLYDSRDKAFSFARGSASTTVINSGYGSATSVLAFPTQLSGLSSAATIYDTTTYKFTAPRTGWYRVELSIPLTVPASTRIRLGLWDGTSLIAHADQYAPSANAQMYSLNTTVFLTQGSTTYAAGNQNASASVNCTPVVSNHEVRFIVQEI